MSYLFDLNDELVSLRRRVRRDNASAAVAWAALLAESLLAMDGVDVIARWGLAVVAMVSASLAIGHLSRWLAARTGDGD